LTSANSSVEGVSNFTYDATNQLTAADHSSQTDENYGYDLNGNRNTSGFTTGQEKREVQPTEFCPAARVSSANSKTLE
jgi:YD repeat-containing protein